MPNFELFAALWAYLIDRPAVLQLLAIQRVFIWAAAAQVNSVITDIRDTPFAFILEESLGKLRLRTKHDKIRLQVFDLSVLRRSFVACSEVSFLIPARSSLN